MENVIVVVREIEVTVSGGGSVEACLIMPKRLPDNVWQISSPSTIFQQLFVAYRHILLRW